MTSGPDAVRRMIDRDRHEALDYLAQGELECSIVRLARCAARAEVLEAVQWKRLAREARAAEADIRAAMQCRRVRMTTWMAASGEAAERQVT